ncbi:MAG: hypothetical protein U0798_20795 [Gemmataceae bacterium]
MARKPKISFPTKSSPTLVGIGIKAGLTVVVGLGLLGALVWIGQNAGQSVSGQSRYQIPIADIQCNTPPGTDRSAFLAEVRTRSHLPETVSAVAAETPPLLAAAFADHPWVSQVNRVNVTQDRVIHVEMTFRTPALAVKIAGEKEMRCVDKTGFLLPVFPITDKIPQLIGEVKNVDATVKRAAEIVSIYQEKRPTKIEKTFLSWRMTTENGQVFNVGW